ncbi:MAG: DUF327 family protein [Synergistaceae bacterium]|nr:DUF327 family protein [Synergistaceae bacterium]
MRVKKSSKETFTGGEFGKTGKKEGGHSAGRPVAPVFSASLEDAEIRELLASLDAVGRKLSIFPAEALLQQYRKLVSEALRRAVSGLRVRRDMKWRMGDRNFFVIVEKTDSLLNDLEAALAREGERARMHRILEEIKGCLFSLLF